MTNRGEAFLVLVFAALENLKKLLSRQAKGSRFRALGFRLEASGFGDYDLRFRGFKLWAGISNFGFRAV